MPNRDEQIAIKLGLRPGDIFVTEMPYEDATASDFPPVTNFKEFVAGHVAIWTGNEFTKSLAHSVSEGYQLPGIRLSKIGDGRHVIFRTSNSALAERIALIARRWSMGTSVYDLERFEQVYPKRFWDSAQNYEKHKRDFFSIPAVKTLGPATPYPFERSSSQLFHRARNANLVKFTTESLRRAVKFAARSELIGPISRGMRCTSFVISTVQAAILSEITRKTSAKTSFKYYKDQRFNDYANTVLVSNWQDSDIGIKVQEALKTQNFETIFGKVMAIDSKYATPNDLFQALITHNTEWGYVGSVSVFEGEIVNLISNSDTQSSSSPACLDEDERKSIPSTQEDALAQQIAQEKGRDKTIGLFATPPKETNSAEPSKYSQFQNRKPNCARKLF